MCEETLEVVFYKKIQAGKGIGIEKQYVNEIAGASIPFPVESAASSISKSNL